MLLISQELATNLAALIVTVIGGLVLVGIFWFKKRDRENFARKHKQQISSESPSEPAHLPPEVVEQYKFGELLVVLTPSHETPKLLAFADMSPEDRDVFSRSTVVRYDGGRPDHQGLLERKWRKIIGLIYRNKEFWKNMTDPTMIAIMNEVINNWDPTYIQEALQNTLQISPKDPLRNTKTEEFLTFLTPPTMKQGARTSLFDLDAQL